MVIHLHYTQTQCLQPAAQAQHPGADQTVNPQQYDYIYIEVLYIYFIKKLKGVIFETNPVFTLTPNSWKRMGA